jgi:hypothetical protein
MSNRAPVVVSHLLAFGLFGGAGYFYSGTQQLISAAQKAPGTIVGFERRTSKGGFSDYPVVEFATASGEVHRFTTSGAGDFAKGEAVEVLYHPDDPANAEVNVFIELWLGSLALGGAGLLCLGLAVANLVVGRDRAESRRKGNVR